MTDTLNIYGEDIMCIPITSANNNKLVDKFDVAIAKSKDN
jgi:hypothetical protein